MEEFLVFRGGVQGNENSNSPRWAHWSFFFFSSSFFPEPVEAYTYDFWKDWITTRRSKHMLHNTWSSKVVRYFPYVHFNADCTEYGVPLLHFFSKYPLQILGACSNVRESSACRHNKTKSQHQSENSNEKNTVINRIQKYKREKEGPKKEKEKKKEKNNYDILSKEGSTWAQKLV